jgi:hypothetical protein
MKLLFDQGTPVPLRHHLSNHTIEATYEKGGSNIKNGVLLTAGEAEGFAALITTDQNLRYQQNLAGRQISIVVLLTTSWPRIKNQIDLIAQEINNLQPGSYIEIPLP